MSETFKLRYITEGGYHHSMHGVIKHPSWPVGREWIYRGLDPIQTARTYRTHALFAFPTAALAKEKHTIDAR